MKDAIKARLLAENPAYAPYLDELFSNYDSEVGELYDKYNRQDFPGLAEQIKKWKDLNEEEKIPLVDAFFTQRTGQRRILLEQVGGSTYAPGRYEFLRDPMVERRRLLEQSKQPLPSGSEVRQASYVDIQRMYDKIANRAILQGIHPEEFRTDKQLESTLEELALSGVIGRRSDGGYGPPSNAPFRAWAAEIPEDVAVRAFYGVSWHNENRGKYTQRRYASTFNRWAEAHLRRVPDKDREELQWLLAEIKEDYRNAYMAYLHAKSVTTSANVTGPAGRNHDREMKKHTTADRREQEAFDILSVRGERRVAGMLKRRLAERQAKASGLDLEGMGRKKIEAVAQLGEAQRREKQAIDFGNSREARERAERAAHLEYKAKMEGEHDFEFDAHTVDLGWRGKHDVSSGTLTIDFDNDAIRIDFDSRLGKESWDKVVVGNGFRYSPHFGSAYRSNITANSVSDALIITGVNLLMEIPMLKERFEEVQRRSDEAKAKREAARKKEREDAKAGVGTFAEVFEAAVKKGAQFKLPAPTDSPKAKKEAAKKKPKVAMISPSVSSRGASGWILRYKTGEVDKSPFGGGMVPHHREIILGFSGRGENTKAFAYHNQYYPSESVIEGTEISVPLSDVPTSEDVPIALEAFQRIVKEKIAHLDNAPLTYSGN
jgi:hypothetical protein